MLKILILTMKTVSVCSGLPISDVPNIATTTVFPVIAGTEVIVSCVDGHRLKDPKINVMTCQEGTTYEYQETPTCNPGKLCTCNMEQRLI